jgi:hypothetical protein
VSWYSELLDINLIWFGYIARHPSGGKGHFTRSNDFYLLSLLFEEEEEGVGGQHPVGATSLKINYLVSWYSELPPSMMMSPC